MRMHVHDLAIPSSQLESLFVPQLQLHGPLTDLTPLEEGKRSIHLPLPVEKVLGICEHKHHLATLALPRKADANQKEREKQGPAVHALSAS